MSDWLGYLIPAAVGLGTAYLGSQAANKAANTASAAANTAADTSAAATDRAAETARLANLDSLAYLREGRDLSRADLAPYQASGLADYGALRANVGTSFTESPGYRFAVDEGVRAIDQGAAAKGLLNSGGRLRELTRYGTGVANQEYGNWLARLQGLAGVGQTATGQAASLASGAGQQGAGLINSAGANIAGMYQQGGSTAANYLTQAGQAQAQGGINSTNAILGGANAGLGLYSLMNQGGWGNVAKPQQQLPLQGPTLSGAPLG